jgi:Spy/CpxP family protein refolding chaperone
MPIPRLAKSAAFAIVSLAATQITFAQIQPDMTPADPGMMRKQHEEPTCHKKVDWEAKHTEMQDKFAQDLSLTPQQKTKIDAMHKAFYDSHKSVFDAQKTRFEELCKIKASGASDAEIHAKMQSIPKTDFETMKKDKEKLDAQIRAALTPEQAKKFDEMKAERAKNWQEKKQSIGKSHWVKPNEQQPTTPPAETVP